MRTLQVISPRRTPSRSRFVKITRRASSPRRRRTSRQLLHQVDQRIEQRLAAVIGDRLHEQGDGESKSRADSLVVNPALLHDDDEASTAKQGWIEPPVVPYQECRWRRNLR